MVDRHSLPTGFKIYQKLDTGIYECGPIGVRHLEYNYPIWVIASLDLKDLKVKEDDLVKVDFDLEYKQENYYIAMVNGRPIIAEPQTEFREIVFNKNYHNKYDEYDEDEDEDEDEDFGAPWPRSNPILEEEKASVVTHVKELITAHEKPFNTPGRGHGFPQYYTNNKSDQSRSPNKMNRRGHGTGRSSAPKRKKLFSYSPTIPPTIPHFKKNKKSSRKSLNKSKTSIKCKKTPYAWKSSSIKKSPFRTLKEAKDAETKYKAGQPIGFTAISSLKSQGRIPRSDGCYVLGDKYSVLKRH